MLQNTIFRLAYIALGAVLVSEIHAATWIVTTNQDELDTLATDGAGISLREAIRDAASGDNINFDPTTFTGGSASTIVLENGQLSIDKSLTIDASILTEHVIIDADGFNTSHRVISISSGNTVVLRHLQLTGGLSRTGGGVSNGGNLALHHCVVSQNLARDNEDRVASSPTKRYSSYGGGIFNYGTLVLEDCEISNNRAVSEELNLPDYGMSAFGGGVYSTGIMSVSGSSIDSNFVIVGPSNEPNFASGGGIYSSGTLDLLNSSVIKNSVEAADSSVAFSSIGGSGLYFASRLSQQQYTPQTTHISHTLFAENYSAIGLVNTFSNGGAVFFSSSAGSDILSINHSTIVSNVASQGGGISFGGGTFDLSDSVIAKNTSTNFPDINIPSDNQDSFTLIGNNLIGDNTGSGASASPLVGTNVAPLDPLLAPLGDYGGPTQTMPPLAGSPAIDAAVGITSIRDQRGLWRMVDGNNDGTLASDLGAAEYQGNINIPDILEAVWDIDIDGDGTPFGIEFVIGSEDEEFIPFSQTHEGDQVVSEFWKNPEALDYTVWILKRTTDLSLPFTEIYRYDGSTMSETLGTDIDSSSSNSTKFVITDEAPPEGSAFYKLEVQLAD